MDTDTCVGFEPLAQCLFRQYLKPVGFHSLECLVYLQPAYRLRPVLFIKNHPQITLSCYTINQLFK
jgi:hypothetical protein